MDSRYSLGDRPLEGVRVLDLSRLLPGPFATMILADLGATVDKIEDPGAGDYLRALPPHKAGMNAVFQQLNRGKRSVVLDLRSEEGRARFFELLPHYDVVLESFRPGVMARLGLDYETLAARHPGVIVCAISGYGQTGPLRDRAGHDLDYVARAGVLALSGPAAGPPSVSGLQVADIGGGAFHAVIGILVALLARHRTGRGRFLDVAMTEAVMGFGSFGLLSALAGDDVIGGASPLAGAVACFSTYRTSDGRAMALAALEPKFIEAFARATELEIDLSILSPGPHQHAWFETLRALFASRTFASWSELAATTDCCLEPVLRPEELARDPQLEARAMFVEVDGLVALRTPMAAPPSGRAPRQGEHTDLVLAEARARAAL